MVLAWYSLSMPIIQSAKKRVRTALKATTRNARTKRNLKTAVKALHAAAQGGKKTSNELRKAQSAIDKAVKKNVIHKNKAARQKRQLARAAKVTAGVGVAVAAKKVIDKKKTAVKKSVTKKPAAKKVPTKKK